MDIALMIEGQDGLTWGRWKRLARAAESLGFMGLFRSDHFTNRNPPDKDSLELWVSLAWLASSTEGLEFGPLVTPVSFRHPVMMARMGKDVDALSGGRLVLGLGAGWQIREHEMFGFPLLDGSGRFDRFEEGVGVVHRLLRDEGRVSLEGEYYQLQEAVLLPRPQEAGRPPILIGGNGRSRTLPLAARYADEWNGVMVGPQEYRELNDHLSGLLEERGRSPKDVRRSVMTGVLFGEGEQALAAKAEARGKTLEEVRQRPDIVGDGPAVVDAIRRYQDAGADRIMLQWLELDDLEALERLARVVLPAFKNG